MLNVSEATKRAFMRDGSHKTYRLVFPELNLTITNDRIVKDSLSLSESICSDSSIEFVGCISSSLKIKIYDINEKLKDKKIELYIKADDTEEIPLFKGIVDSATIQAERAFKEIEAYDELYKIGQKEIASWYNKLSYPTTIGAIRKSLFKEIGLECDDVKLPNDDISLPEKKFENINSLKALTVLKSICQANGMFGMMTREGKFQFKKVPAAIDRVFPSNDLYPGSDTEPVGYDSSFTSGYFSFNEYKTIKYEEFFVKPIERIQIRDSEDDPGIVYGGDKGNKYIIQSNMFFFDLSDDSLNKAASNIKKSVGSFTYHPCDIENLGLPFLECGDIVSYPIVRHYGEKGNYDVNTFVILSRTLKGEQLLFDNYISEGEEEQSEFVTDIQSQLNSLKYGGVDMSDYYTADEIDQKLDDDYLTADDTADLINETIDTLDEPTNFGVVSCYTLPSNREPNTIYLIQGMIITL